MILKNNKMCLLMLAVVLLAGCKASGNQRAPIEERDLLSKKFNSVKKSGQRDQDTRAQFYVVQKGDTLYSIAFDNGLDYREVAEQNGIDNPAAIQIGQQIKLLAVDDGSSSERPRGETKVSVASISANVPKKDQPKVSKVPYSAQAVAQIEKSQSTSGQTTVAITAAPAPVPKSPPDTDSGSDESLNWGLPTNGKVIAEYSESASRKGVDIAGTKGQPILASEGGKVVYSGSGLRGYGKLVIIKHNKTFLSAYAHNEQILVKEGQVISKGQKIAEMGSTDSDQVKLHFEIRKFGKPVDPAKFLNFSAS